MLVRRVDSKAKSALADELLGLGFGDAEDRESGFFALAVPDVAMALVSRLLLFPCGSLAGDSTFLRFVVFDKEDCLGVPVLSGALRTGVAVAPGRASRGRMGEGAGFEMEVLLRFPADSLGVAFALVSSGGFLSFF